MPVDLLEGIGGSSPKEQFVSKVLPHAARAAEQLGISPEILIAQSALETGWGRSVPAGNYFGIKAHGWKGPSVAAGTSEFRDGGYQREQASFRGYASPEESFNDYVRFLRDNPRYTEALIAGSQGDDAAYVQSLHKAGYATDPGYSNKILSIAGELGKTVIGGSRVQAADRPPKDLFEGLETEAPSREPVDLLEGLDTKPIETSQPSESVDLLEGTPAPVAEKIEQNVDIGKLTPFTIDEVTGIPQAPAIQSVPLPSTLTIEIGGEKGAPVIQPEQPPLAIEPVAEDQPEMAVPSAWEAVKQGLLEGLNFGWASESAALVRSGIDWLTGADPNFQENYKRLEEQYETYRKGVERARPFSSVIGEVAGSIPTSVAGGAALRTIPSVGALAKSHPILEAGLESAALSAPYGAGKDEENRLKGAMVYGAMGGVTGVGLAGIQRGRDLLKDILPATKPLQAIPEEALGRPQAVGAEVVANPPGARLAESLESVTHGVNQFYRQTIRFLGGKSISYLDDVAKDSPTAAALRAQIEHPERGFRETLTAPVAGDFTERTMSQNGRFQTRLQEALKPIQGGVLGRLSPQQNKALLDDLRNPEATTTAGKAVRSLLDDAASYAKEAGLDLGYIPGYVPRVYNVGYLQSSEKARQGLEAVFTKYGIPSEDAADIVSRIIHEEGVPISVGQSMFRSLLKSGEKSFEKSRTLGFIPDSELEPYLINKAEEILPRYLSAVTKRAEWARIFGQDGEKLSTYLGRIREELASVGKSLKPDEENQLIGIADAMRGAYKPIRTEGLSTANRTFLSYQYLRTMTLSLLSQPGEVWTGLERGGPLNFVKAMGTMGANLARGFGRSVLRMDIPKAESELAVSNAGVALDKALVDILRESNVTGSLTGKTQKITEAFFTLNGMKLWNSFSRRFAFHQGRFLIGSELRKVADGKPGKHTTQKLLELGIDPQAGVEWLKRGGSMADDFYRTIEQAAIRYTNEVAMAPRATVKPLWMSDPHYALMAQLKPFNTVYGNTVVKRMIKKLAGQEGVEGIVNTLAGSALAYYTVANMLELRKLIKYGPDEKNRPRSDIPEWLEVADRAGFTGAMQPLVDMRFQHRFQSPWYTSAFGPGMSQIGSAGQALIEGSKGKEKPVQREIINAIPVLNSTPALRDLLSEFLFNEPLKSRKKGKSTSRQDKR